ILGHEELRQRAVEYLGDDRIAGWGWQDGLHPDPKAPVMKMDEFRDRFLTAFGSQAGPRTR
ncbi:hypothetical protein ACFQ1S_32200, partial [Kibdelosporangium lantanae]